MVKIIIITKTENPAKQGALANVCTASYACRFEVTDVCTKISQCHTEEAGALLKRRGEEDLVGS